MLVMKESVSQSKQEKRNLHAFLRAPKKMSMKQIHAEII